jgi:hypothetical protein
MAGLHSWHLNYVPKSGINGKSIGFSERRGLNQTAAGKARIANAR